MIGFDIPSLCFLPRTEDDVARYINNALDFFEEVPSHAFIAKRYQYTHAGAGATETVTLYPNKIPVLNGVQDTKIFFLGKCIFKFYATALVDPYSVTVYSDSASGANGQAAGGIDSFNSNIVSPLQKQQVITVPVPEYPITSLRADSFVPVGTTFVYSVLWIGLLFIKK